MITFCLLSGASVRKRNKARATPLHDACCSGKEEIVAAFIEAGADVNAADCFGSSALHLASRHGHVAATKQLLEAGADWTSTDELGATPREIAKQSAQALRRRKPGVAEQCLEVARVLREETPVRWLNLPHGSRAP